MADDSSFPALMLRLRAGDESAATEVFRRFAGRLIALARSHLDSRLRQKVDPEDVLQSAFKSFFLRQGREPFDLDNWDGLWALLVTITLRKCGDRAVYFRRARRNVEREAVAQPNADGGIDSWVALARDPSPSEAAILAETVEQVLRDLEEHQRHILQLHLQGHTVAQISAQLDLSERTVHRVLKGIRDRLEQASSGDGSKESRETL